MRGVLFSLHSQGDSSFHHVSRTWLRGPHSKPNSITASLYMLHVFLAFFGAVITQCVYYFHAHYAWWKTLSSQGRVSLWRCPLGRWDTQSGDKGLLLTQVTLNLGWGRAAVAPGRSARTRPGRAFHSFIVRLFYSQFSQSLREATRLKERLLTVHMELSVFILRQLVTILSLHLDLIALTSAWLIRFWWSATQHFTRVPLLLKLALLKW